MDMSLPIAADISYNFGILSVEMDYFGIGRSFNVNYENSSTLYAAVSSLEFEGYLQSDLFEKSILLRAKIGYTTNDYELYAQDDKIDLGISAFRFGDNREQLNPTIWTEFSLGWKPFIDFTFNRQLNFLKKLFYI